jgi:predicted enzyme related to lactoylglutathione lyase
MVSHRGKFVWFELMTPDLPAAEKFYHRVLGWTVKDSGMTHMTYKLAEAGEVQVAGMMNLPPGAHPAWVGYVAVDDVDAGAAQVKDEGGTVHHAPTDIPDVGRFAIVADPHGAMLALFKGAPGDTPPAVPPWTSGHVGWRELYAGDLDEAFGFYNKLFGWTKAQIVDMGPMGIYQIFAIDGRESGGMMTKPAQVPMPSWLYYFNVDGADAAAGRVREAGGQVLMGPHEVPGGSWIVQCLDPHGAAFAVVSAKR